ncbi:MAG: 30S ribosomal protein S7 [Candidatus Diapherotrites archaeon CG08_land_8_20_14_0_20_34_12]|nr:MAG: 30S ribosomal protein S7 [Candidatus Diapherotrites archaeon CG08_land_8_20_14_0_20_34_12]
MEKIFDKWDTSGIVVKDIGLAKYMNLEGRIIPHTFGRDANKKFAKTRKHVVERLVNKIMRSGQGKKMLSGKYIRGRGSCGKKLQALRIVEGAFDLVEARTKQNPIQVFVSALEHASPREDTTRFKRGGVAYSQSVDVAPIKRLDDSLKNMALAAFINSFNRNVSAESALANELILAANEDNKSLAIKRRDEVERIAKSSR